MTTDKISTDDCEPHRLDYLVNETCPNCGRPSTTGRPSRGPEMLTSTTWQSSSTRALAPTSRERFDPIDEAIKVEERAHPGSLMVIAADESQPKDVRGVAARMAVEMLGASTSATVRVGARMGAEELDGLEAEMAEKASEDSKST